MKRKNKIVLKCAVTLILLIMALYCLKGRLERKASEEKYVEFFGQEENFDVLFFGSSHMINGVFPMELWNDYGIVSYNFGTHGCMLPTTYWVLENALDYTTPKLVVIDCHYLESDSKMNDSFTYVHQAFDTFPLSATKIRAVLDLADHPYTGEDAPDINTTDIISELLWNYTVYHDRWSDLTERDFEIAASKEKGAQSRIAVATPDEMEVISSDEKFEEDSVGIEYLEKIIEECQSRGIDVLLTYLPFPAPEQDQLNANRVYDIAEEYGVSYINFLDMDVVNFKTDCYDQDSHLNPSGARKVTEALGQFITEHYDITDQRDNTAYSSWYDDYNRYRNVKQYYIRNQKALDVYLMLLSDKDLDVTISVQNPGIWYVEHLTDMMENLGVDLQQITDDTTSIEIQQAGVCVIYQTADTSEGAGNTDQMVGPSGKGHITYRTIDPLDEAQTDDSSEEERDADIILKVTWHDTGQLVDEAEFDIKTGRR